MNRTFFLFLLATFSLAFKGENTANEELFISELGIGPVRIFQTTVEEAKDKLDVPNQVSDISYYAERRSYNNVKKCYYSYVYYYKLKDTVNDVEYYGEYRDLHLITFIKIGENCKWKTKEGIGIGSTYDELQAAYGKRDDFWPMNDGGAQVESMFFFTDKDATEKNRKINRIEINAYFHHPYDYREPKGPAYKEIHRVKCPPPCMKC